jgi:xanthine phosphoribosyltransferase
MKDDKERFLVSWELFDVYARRIVDDLRGKRPFDVVVPILRGGLPLATVISYHLDIKEIEPIYWSSKSKYKDISRLYYILDYFSNLLFVDDIIDTGETVNEIADHISGSSPIKPVIATLIKRPSIPVQLFQVIYGDSFDSGWIDFPWDLT